MTTSHDQHDVPEPGGRDLSPDEVVPRLVDWELAGRRLLWSAVVLLAAAGAGWVAVSLAAGQWRAGMLGNLVGLALVGVFLVEVWVVGGSALRGMLRAGEGGQRLAGSDVGLLPPQLRPGGSITPALARATREGPADPDPADDDGRDGEASS